LQNEQKADQVCINICLYELVFKINIFIRNLEKSLVWQILGILETRIEDKRIGR
jgi:hypothetical protein